MTDMQTSLPLLIVRPSILNLVINFSTHLSPVKWNAQKVIPLPCVFHSISSNVDATHAPTNITNDMIHFISSRDLIGSSILTSLALHRCFGLSAPSLFSSFSATWFITSKPPTCPSCLQPVHLAKPHLDLLHLVTWLHVMFHMQWAPSSHVWSLQHIQAIFTVMAWVSHTSVPVD